MLVQQRWPRACVTVTHTHKQGLTNFPLCPDQETQQKAEPMHGLGRAQAMAWEAPCFPYRTCPFCGHLWAIAEPASGPPLPSDQVEGFLWAGHLQAP